MSITINVESNAHDMHEDELQIYNAYDCLDKQNLYVYMIIVNNDCDSMNETMIFQC